MMAKPMKTPELRYPMIRFLIIRTMVFEDVFYRVLIPGRQLETFPGESYFHEM